MTHKLRITFNRIIAVAALAGVVGCGAAASTPDAGPSFYARSADFQGFESWTSETIDDPNPGGSTHVSGNRTIYINHVPPAGATTFPLGTIIVKRTETDGRIFAQVKRGGGYNARGAVDWEWFELTEPSPGVASIRWEGTQPAPGESYGGDPTGGCNTCHVLGAANDYVLTPGFALSHFGFDAGAEADASHADGAAPEVQSDAGVDTTGTETGAGTDTGADAGTDTGEEDASHE